MVSRAVQAAGSDDRPGAIAEALLAQNPSLRFTKEFVEQTLDPKHFVSVRRIIGGPAPEVVRESLKRARAEQSTMEEWIRARRQQLDTARRRNTGA